MAPLAIKLVVLPEQIVAELTVIVGVALTVTELVAVDEHKPVIPTTVYSVVDIGVASTVDPAVAFKTLAGDQL